MPGSTTPVEHDVYIGSLDMDGCVLNNTFLTKILADTKAGKKLYDDKAAYKNELMRTNANLLAHFKANKAATNYLICGSARQDFLINASNAQKYLRPNFITVGSATAILKDLVAELNAAPDTTGFELDKLLLGSIFTNERSKDEYFDRVDRETDQFLATYNKPALEVYPDRDIDFVFDESKFLIVYAQMHHAAMQNPGKKIHYEFFDDRDDILEALYKVFEIYPEFIPPDVTLTLKKYNGELTAPYENLQGNEKSKVDNNFAQTIRSFAAYSYRKVHINGTDRTILDMDKITAILKRAMKDKKLVKIANLPLSIFRGYLNQSRKVLAESTATLVTKFMLLRSGTDVSSAEKAPTAAQEEAAKLLAEAIAHDVTVPAAAAS